MFVFDLHGVLHSRCNLGPLAYAVGVSVRPDIPLTVCASRDDLALLFGVVYGLSFLRVLLKVKGSGLVGSLWQAR